MNRLGYLAVSLAAVLWAFGGTYARRLIDDGASALEITEARAWIATAGVGLFLWLRRPREPASPVRPGLLLAFGVAIAVANYTYYLAVSSLPVAIAIVVQYTAPALVVVWLAFMERRAPSRRVAGALMLALAGVALLAEVPRMVSTGELRLSAAGLAAAGISAIGFAAYVVLGERVRAALGAQRALFAGFAVAGGIWAGVQAVRGRPETLLDADFVPHVIIIGVVTTIAPFFLFLWGMGHIGAARAGIVSTLEPVSGALIAWIWLGQSLGGAQIAGAALVVAGIAIVQSEQSAGVATPPVD